MNTASILRKCSRHLQRGTILTAIKAKVQSSMKSLIKHTIGFEWQHYYVLSLNCDSLYKKLAISASDPNLRIATEKDWYDPILVQELGPDKINYIIERCNNANFCCVIYKEKQVRCFGFISYREMELKNNIKYVLPKNEAFFYDDYCLTAYRRQGLYRKVLNERCRLIEQKGFNKVLTIVSPANGPSWQGHKSWNKEQSFYWIKFRGREYCTLKHYKPIQNSL